jgi:hypothetical protein
MIHDSEGSRPWAGEPLTDPGISETGIISEQDIDAFLDALGT